MISLLIISHEEQDKLACHLPTLLSQEGAEYEVVVVDMNSEDDTLEVLTSMEEKYPHLRHLSMPTSAKDISHERLALHLGLRATDSPQVIILNASIEAPSTHWIADIASHWRTDCDIMLIPTKRVRSKGFKDYFTAGHEAWHAALYKRQALGSRLFRASTSVVGLKKKVFLTRSSPAQHLALKTGTLDIFVSHVATPYNTIRITEEELYPSDDSITSYHQWLQKRLFEMETCQHLTKSFKRRITYIAHCLCTIHRGSIPYCIMDMIDYMRWRFTSNKTFIKKHY